MAKDKNKDAPAKKKATAAKKSPSKSALLPVVTNTAPTAAEVRDELTIFWDAISPLSLNSVRAACDAGKTLDDVGLNEDQAQGCVNKYNSIVLRAPGKGPLVTSTEARKSLASKMQDIIKTVTERAQP